MGPWASEQPLPSLAPGQILEGKYKIVRELGRGAMGVVHEALHMALGRRVAIKTLLAETGPDPDLVARFEREARAASAIGHPHIVDVFDLGRTPEGVPPHACPAPYPTDTATRQAVTRPRPPSSSAAHRPRAPRGRRPARSPRA